MPGRLQSMGSQESHDLATKPPPGGKKGQAQALSSALPAQNLGTYAPCLSFCLIIFQIKKIIPMIYSWSSYEILLIKGGEQHVAYTGLMGVFPSSFI